MAMGFFGLTGNRGLALSGCHGPCSLGRAPTPCDALAGLTDADHWRHKNTGRKWGVRPG